MKKSNMIWIVVIVLFLASLGFVKNYYDKESQMLKEYEKENYKLGLLADRLENQFKIASYREKLGIRMARPVNKPAVEPRE